MRDSTTVIRLSEEPFCYRKMADRKINTCHCSYYFAAQHLSVSEEIPVVSVRLTSGI